MPDYKSMYYRLFNRVTDAIHVLQSAQKEAETAFIEDESDNILQLIVAEDDEGDGE